MKVSFANANSYNTGESFVLRFAPDGSEDAACVLVDSGEGVDVDAMLSDGDYLAGVMLTHAHSDHYCTLPENHRPNIPVFVSPDTERLLPSVLRSNRDHLDIGGDIESVVNHLQAVGDEWVQIAPGVDIRAVPSGHAPGACGFIVRLDTAPVEHMLITGDFTRRPVAGNEGISLDYPVGIDAVFFNTTAQGDATDPLTESLNDVVEGYLSGGPTLLATDALVGVHYAHLISGVCEERSLDPTITLVGQAATLHDRLDRDLPHVRTVPDFADAEEVLSDTDICVGGPSTLVEGSSRVLFNVIKKDPSGRVVAIGDGDDVRTEAHCVSRYPYIGHPSREKAEEVVRSLSPKETIIEHGNDDRYGTVFDFCYTWACAGTTRRTIYEDGRWLPPEWVGGTTRQQVLSHHSGALSINHADSDEVADDQWPSVTASGTTPEEEGVDMSGINGGACGSAAGTETTTSKYSTTATSGAGDADPSRQVAIGNGGSVTASGGADATETPPEPSVETESTEEAGCGIVEATVITTGDGNYLMQVDSDKLGMDLDHRETVTAIIQPED